MTASLNIEEVFTPAPSGVGPGAPALGSWLGILLENAGVLGLTATSWQSGGIARTLMAIMATALASEDSVASIMAQGGFLDFAATGTVTYTSPISGATVTQYVTPDPSNPSTWSVPGTVPGPGWLDILADSTFNCQRISATYAGGVITFISTSAQAYGPYAPGTFHIANPTTGATYSNTTSLTIAANGTTSGNFAADVAGTGSSSSSNQITQLVTSLVGATCTNASSFVGSNYESNTALAARCRLKVQSLSPNGPKGAYAYFALTASQILENQTLDGSTDASSLLSTPITQALPIVNLGTGTVDTYVANSAGPVSGVAGLTVSGATNASPIVLTVSSTTGLSTGNVVLVQGVEGNTAANGYWQITVLSGTTFSLTGSTGNGSYTAGGTVEAGDLGLVDSVIQANVVPLGVTAVTLSATGQTATLAMTVYAPAAMANGVAAAINAAMLNFFPTIPIGGFTTGVPTPNTLPIETIEAAINQAVPQIRDIALTINGVAADLAVGTTSVPILAWSGGTYQTAINVVPF